MHTQKHLLLALASVTTVVFVGAYGPVFQAQVQPEEEKGWAFIVKPSSSSAAASSAAYVPRCGNAVRDPGEECDDGNFVDTDGCTIACRKPLCGDGIVQVGEQCDDGNTRDIDGCTRSCTLARCGDGFVQPGESCDSGTANSNIVPDRCRLDCAFPHCGDRVIDRGEECDGGDTCTPECRRLKSAATLLADTPSEGKTAIILSLVGGLFVFSFIFRTFVHRVVRRVAGEKVARSIDDIPLDEIEMPWHKW